MDKSPYSLDFCIIEYLYFPTKLFFKNYVNFTGRSTRSEYWFAYLFVFLVGLGVSVINMFLQTALGSEATLVVRILNLAESLVFLLPNLSIQVRRLHDIGKSGWWVIGSLIILIVSIPLFILTSGDLDALLGVLCCVSLVLLVYAIVMIIFFCRPSVGPNKWGPPARPNIRY